MSGTSPDSVSYPSQPYGLLGPYPWQTVNVQDFGATGDGVTDDGPRFQLALDALAGGGILIIPPAPSGVYVIGQCLRHPSYLMVRGSGAAATLKMPFDFTPSSDYGGTGMWLNEHSQATETAFTGWRDFQITFENVWFDLTDALSGGYHALFHRAVQRLRVLNCRFTGGGDGTACVTCDDVLIDGCTAVEQLNCCYDHWGGSTNCRVINSYASVAAASVSQAVNFNGIRTSIGTGTSEVWISDGFTLANCDIYGNATQRSISLEPLGLNTSMCKNIRIIGNRLYNIRIVMSGNTSNVVIEGNQFIGAGANSNIWARTQNALDADLITVVGNQFKDCVIPTTFGLIDSSATNTTVIGNTEVGCTYEYGVRFRSSVTGVYLANKFQNASISETLGAWNIGTDIQVAQQRKLGVLSSTGVPAHLVIDNTNTLYLIGVTAADGPRSLFSCTMGSSTSSFQIYPNVVMSGIVRNGYAEGLVAECSSASDPLALTEQNNVVATTAAGTGVRLPTPTGGGVTISVYNDGANTLNVYPPAGGQINGGGVNIPATVAAGASGRWTSISTSQYRTAA